MVVGWLPAQQLLRPFRPHRPSRSLTGIRFDETAAKSGLHFTTSNSPTPNKNQIETMVAGVALFDYDGDGYLDIYLVNGAAIPSLQKDSPKYWNRLFHNNHNGTFTDVTEKAGVAGAGYGMGVAIGDYDNDGRPDIFVANVTGNQLFHNNGDGTFTDVTEKAGLSGAKLNGKKMWSVGAGWFDYNNDGLLDLFVVNYCQWEVNKDPYCAVKSGVRAYCHPKQYAPLHNTLYRNNGDGTFTDVSEETGIAKLEGKGMSVSFADYDRRWVPRRLRRQRHDAGFPVPQPEGQEVRGGRRSCGRGVRARRWRSVGDGFGLPRCEQRRLA